MGRERDGTSPPKEASQPAHHSPNLQLPIVAMGVEDQKEEREVLESIFPEEITGRPLGQRLHVLHTHNCVDVSETEFRILITLDDGRHEDDETEEEQRMYT